MKPILILAAGWGFDERFWQPLSLELSNYQIVYDSQNYFHIDSFNPVINKPAICIGHSYGFARLIKKYGSIENTLGFISICGFLSFARFSATLFEQNSNMITAFRKSPKTVLRHFYRKCGLSNWSQIPTNHQLLENDLKELNNLDIKLPHKPALAILAKQDRILTQKLSPVPNNKQQIIDAGHALGYQCPKECAKIRLNCAMCGYRNECQ